MAARDNQGLQAIIIVLTLLVIGLGVWLLVTNNSKKTALARASEAESQQQEARRVQAELQEQANAFKQWMGFGEGDSYAALQTAHQEAMTRFGSNFEEASRNYRTILDSVFEENRKLALNETSAKEQVKELKDRLTAVESQKEVQVKQFEEEMKKLAAELAGEKNKFEEQYRTINEKNESLANELRQKQQQSDEQIAGLEKSVADRDAEVRKLETSVDKLKEGLPTVDQFAQPADGQITWVNQGERKAWINLGSADGLRPQVTFSVSNALDADAAKAEKKGSIEVVRVISEHMSEARITSDESINPLVPGDQIYSQVWDRGRQVGFGIAGFIDIDGDGRSDLEQLQRIIGASNGRVDAGPNEEGEKQGELRVDTRYLVLGDYPTDPRLTDYLSKHWEQIGQEADRLGVETIPLQEFLKLMGWQNDARAATLGAAGSAADFPAKPPGEARPRAPRPPRGVFEKRLPPISY